MHFVCSYSHSDGKGAEPSTKGGDIHQGAGPITRGQGQSSGATDLHLEVIPVDLEEEVGQRPLEQSGGAEHQDQLHTAPREQALEGGGKWTGTGS